MRIIFTTDTIQRGGKERQLFILATSLQRKGVDVFIITLRRDLCTYEKEYEYDSKKILEVDLIGICEKYKWFKKVFRDLNPDVVFAWDVQTALFALFRHRKDGFAFINGSVQHGVRLLRVSHILRSIVCWLSPCVVSNSLAGLRANNMRSGSRRFILNNGIEDRFYDRYSREEVERQRMEMITGYGEEPGQVFVSVGNLVPFKDYFTVLRALRKYDRLANFYYLIIGEGPMREEIERKISEYGLGGRVLLTGRIDNVVEYLRIGDCLIHSSRGEGISNAILEAMYAGLPIIATDVGGIPETVFPASSMLFPYKDHEALYRCLIKLPELKVTFNPDAEDYKMHLERFSVEKMITRFEEIIGAVMSDRKRPA